MGRPSVKIENVVPLGLHCEACLKELETYSVCQRCGCHLCKECIAEHKIGHRLNSVLCLQ
jgi:hypothetical protein